MQTFMCVAMLFGSLFTFPSEMKMLLKERSSGMYNLSAYYIARSSASMPLELLYPTIFSILAYWMGALRPQVSRAISCFTIFFIKAVLDQV